MTQEAISITTLLGSPEFKEALWWDDIRVCLHEVQVLVSGEIDDEIIDNFEALAPARTERWKTMSLATRATIVSYFVGWAVAIKAQQREQQELLRESNELSEAAII